MYELRSAEIVPETKQVVYEYSEGRGKTTFVIVLDTNQGYTYAIIQFELPVFPGAATEQRIAWIYKGGVFSRADALFTYAYPTFEESIENNGTCIFTRSTEHERIVIKANNFDEFKKLPGFEGFILREMLDSSRNR